MNFYLKVFGALLIVSSSTLVGFWYSLKINKRIEILICYIDFLNNLQTGIRYCCDDIFTLINKYASSKQMEFLIADNTSNFNEYWQSSLNKIPQSYGLTKEDINLLKDFGVVLGVTDVEGQIQHIELYKKLFETQLKKAETQQKTKSKLYKVMGFFIGTVTVLMII